MDDTLLGIRYDTALQQPPWKDNARLAAVREDLTRRAPLVQAHDVDALHTLLARVAAGEAHVLQAGDCAEDPAEATADQVARKAGLMNMLAGALELESGRPVVRVGRIAGQYGKPRSNDHERVGDLELLSYRGHMVNSPLPDPTARIPDPDRLLTGYEAAYAIVGHLGWRGPRAVTRVGGPVWTSHEALLLDYEVPMLRRDEQGRLLLASTHWPWIGERTRQLDGAHVALLAQVANPVACKVGPRMETGELLALCARLDPERTPGRLTLIARMGVTAVADRLPALVEAVRVEGHPVSWLSDPMHGNTVTTPDGVKTRYLDTITQEIDRFQTAVTEAGGTPGGLHLETTPDDVTECVTDSSAAADAGVAYTSFCDPRLNPAQALAAVGAWWVSRQPAVAA
ncbi:3-deoxy-7-phosphoheptulonate synthase [Streptomyces turgidiscabies]|uniref:Phospho-2-dehydro-3-deoxyheptonate aldolase n=1 Tax=Streptomyces turgidiscabies TaxID=85558 RepID=A0ABU0RID6_9ACTN|nr:3-deoxy-7-phosphoheptulonate synthase [Streptomyces turgidiscabies]MDQ0930750.1 3-deoxy-7-phosphoheptulonate synthase [Streptomyces turgidiscabies]